MIRGLSSAGVSKRYGKAFNASAMTNQAQSDISKAVQTFASYCILTGYTTMTSLHHSSTLQNRQKKAVIINDLSGFGRASMAVQLPVLSVLQAECLLMPTALLSAHTGYPGWMMKDLSEDIAPWTNHWKQLHICPDAILTGFLASAKEAKSILAFLDAFRQDQPLVVADPAFADGQKLYPSCTPDFIEAMLSLCLQADVITPNITEAAFLCGMEQKELWEEKEIIQCAEKLHGMQVKSMAITGILLKDGQMADFMMEANGTFQWRKYQPSQKGRPGTGDLFASALCGLLMQGFAFFDAAAKAGEFVQSCLEETSRLQVPDQEGCAFEPVLGMLMDWIRIQH